MKDLQEKHKIPVTDGLLAKVRAVTVIVPAKPELPKNAKSIPMLVLHLDDAAAAGAWEEFLPKLVGNIAGESASQPSSETVGGVKVLSLSGTGLPWKSAVHYARRDNVLAIGQDRKLVAAAVVPDAAASVAGGDKPLVVPAGDYALLGTMNLARCLPRSISRRPAGRRPLEPPQRFRRGDDSIPQDELLKEADKARAAFLGAFGELPSAVVTVRRTGDELRFEVFQPKVQNGGLTPIITAGVNWFEKLMGLRNDGDFPIEGPIYGKW